MWQVLEKGDIQTVYKKYRRSYKNYMYINNCFIFYIKYYYSLILIIKNESRMFHQIFVNQKVSQGYSISPTLFNIYIGNLVRKWEQLVNSC